MIGKIISGIFKLVISLVNVILLPIDSLITSTLPSLDSALNAVNIVIDYIVSVIGYAVNMSGLSSVGINLIIAYFSFVLVVPLGVSVVKMALKWYNTLKP